MSFSTFSKSLPPSLSLAGRTALITGASSGIGRQTALHLARVGASIFCADLRPEPIDDRPAPKAGATEPLGSPARQGSRHVPTHELINRLGGKAEFQKLDVRNEVDFKKSMASAVELGNGRLDVMINNAGITSFSGGIEGESLDILDRMLAVNVKGLYIGTQLAIRQMMKQEPLAFPADLEEDLDANEEEDISSQPRSRPPFSEEQGPPATVGRLPGDKGGRGSRGNIVNIASIHGLIGGPGEPAYCASKGAVINLTRQVACDYAKHRINVNAICPGYLDTAMTVNIPEEISKQRPTYWPHRGSARDVAKSVMYFARDAPWSTGTILALDGGTTAR
ncbi:uncharacterized protein PFL1_00968 [Pseudozyma flocculosa PF-1]|uniref:uncharacterized protein n=1 Tax=Pseudozyma flocculosa PF-1 TaxID=1277687 RepID=UPI0004561850|nr:uncharacterized protein PFL1_00968 [Pseudozyma flocculosa PF-1]EPQ31635.1 hypothetical protein PFL1_00968 [Pseudozyma flocculosa PF-1]